MQSYTSLPRKALVRLHGQLAKEYADFQARGLALNMARGKPSAEQLDLSAGLLTCVDSSAACFAENGADTRNYGGLEGIPEARRLFAALFDVPAQNIIVGGNSSLNMMYDAVARAMTHGLLGSTPWARLPRVKFLCPAPGYDRHFAVCAHFGIEMIPVEMKDDGPDMVKVKALAENDPAVKGIWCVPKYSNPEGKTYSDAVVDAFAALRPAADDFRIFWDNAYVIHHLTGTPDRLKNLFEALRAAGRPDMAYIFASTSKCTFPGAGVAALAASDANIAEIRRRISVQTIGADKINQLRHVRFFKDLTGLQAHMKKHAAILAPKFAAVLNILEQDLGGTGIAGWTKPRGGYFISFNALDGTAAHVVRLCKEAGLTVTPAGATFPYGKDPRDRNIRIAPSAPPLAELKTAIGLFALCVKLAAVEKLLDTHAAPAAAGV